MAVITVERPLGMEDKQIVELFFSRDERAIAECQNVYSNYCFTVAYNILGSRQDCEECLNDTWLKAWNSIPPQKPANLKMYLARIARNTALDVYYRDNAEKRVNSKMTVAYEELANIVSDTDGEVDLHLLEDSINRFLARQKKRDRSVFIRKYFYWEDNEEIAERYGLSETNVSTILNRTRTRLRDFLRKEGYEL